MEDNIAVLLKLLSLSKTTRSSFEACIIRDILINSSHPLITTYRLKKEAITKIAQTATVEAYDPHKLIYQQNEISEKLYVVLSGSVGIYFPLNYSLTFEEAREGVQDEIFNYTVEDYKRQLRLIRKVEKGAWFGDLGLLNHGSNNSIAISETPVHLMVIEHAEYHAFLVEKELNNLYQKLKVFSSNMFQNCSPNSKRIFFNLSKKINFRQNQSLVIEDQPVQDIFIIKKGDFVISKLIYDENTMAEYLTDPMKVAAQYSGQQFMRAKPKTNNRYARNTYLKVIQKNDIVGDIDVAAKRNSSFTCKCENIQGGSTLAIPSEVFLFVYQHDQQFQQSVRQVLRAKAQEFQERVHTISIQMQKFGDFFFFKGRQELQQDQEISMANLGEKFANYEKKVKGKITTASSQTTEAVSQIVESIRDQEREAKSCYDFTYFPINKNKISLHFDKTFPLSSTDYDADPAANLSSDGKSSHMFGLSSSAHSKKQSFHTITSPLNLLSPTYQGFLQNEQISSEQGKITKSEQNENDLNQESDSNKNQQETQWSTEIYPFGVQAKPGSDQSPPSSPYQKKHLLGFSPKHKNSTFSLKQEESLVPAKKLSKLSIIENTNEEPSGRCLLPEIEEEALQSEKPQKKISKQLFQFEVADDNPKGEVKEKEEENQSSDNSSNHSSPSEEKQFFKPNDLFLKKNESIDSPLSATSPPFHISSFVWQPHYSVLANTQEKTNTTAATVSERNDLSEVQIETKNLKSVQSQQLNIHPVIKTREKNINSQTKKSYSMQSGREMIRDKLLQKAVDSTESMKLDVMKDKDIIVVSDLKQTGRNELKSLMEIQNLQKKMTEKQDPTKYDHRIKAQQMRVLDLNIKLREQRGKEGLDLARKIKEMQFNDISEDEKRKMIKSQLEKLGLQVHISPTQSLSSRSMKDTDRSSTPLSDRKTQKYANSSLNISKHQKNNSNSGKDYKNSTHESNNNISLNESKLNSQQIYSQSARELPFRQRTQVPRRLPPNLSPKTAQKFNQTVKSAHSSFLAEATNQQFFNPHKSNSGKFNFISEQRHSSFINYNEATLDEISLQKQAESTSINNINSKHSLGGNTSMNHQASLNGLPTSSNLASQNSLPQNGAETSQQDSPTGHNRQISQTKQKKIHFRNSVDEYLQMKAQALSTNYDKKKLKSQDLPFLDSYANQLQINLKRLFYVKLQQKYGKEDSLDNMQDRIADQMLDQNFKQFLKKNKDILPQKKNLNYLYNWRNSVESTNQGSQQTASQQQQSLQTVESPKLNYLKDSIPTQGFSFKQQKLPQLYRNNRIQNTDESMNIHTTTSVSHLNTDNSISQRYLSPNYNQKHHLNSYYCSQTEQTIQNNSSLNDLNNVSLDGRESFISQRNKRFATNMAQISQRKSKQQIQTILQLQTSTKRSTTDRTIQNITSSQETLDKIKNLEFQNDKTIYSNQQAHLLEQQEKAKNELVKLNQMFSANKRAEKALEQDKKLFSSSAFDLKQTLSQSSSLSARNEKTEETNKINYLDGKTTLSRKYFLGNKNKQGHNNNNNNNQKDTDNGELSVEQEMKELTHSIILKYGLQARFKHKEYQVKK